MTDNYIVITRPLEDQKIFSKQLEEIGLQVFLYPTIQIKKAMLTEIEKEELKNLDSFDWILFTSKNGVRYLLDTLDELGINPSLLTHKKIGVVGPRTAEELKDNDLTVDFMPSQFTTEVLAKEFPKAKAQNILLPRADIASETLTKLLIKHGAKVTNIPIYKTEYLVKPNQGFEKLLNRHKIAYITFTSPSTIHGFFNSLNKKSNPSVLSVPVLALGPVTEKAAKKEGFTSVLVADTFTTEGMIKKLKEIV